MPPGQDNADLFLRVFSESKEARDDLTGLIATLKALDKEDASPEVDVGIEKAQAKIKKLGTELMMLGGAKASPEIEIDTKKAEGQLALFSAQLASLSDPESKELHAVAQFDWEEAGTQIEMFKTRYRDLGTFTAHGDFDDRQAKNEIFSLLHEAKRVPAEFEDALGNLTLFSERVGALASEDVKVNVDVDDHGQLSMLQREFEGLQPSIKKDQDQLELFAEQLQMFGSVIAGTRSEHGIKFEIDDNLPTEMTKLAAFNAALDELDHKSVSPHVDVGISEAQLQLAVIHTQLDLLDRERVNVKINTDWNALERLSFAVASVFTSGASAAKDFIKDIDSVGSAAKAIGGLLQSGAAGAKEMASSLFSLGEGAGGAGKSFGGLTANLGPFGAKLTSVVAAVLVLVAVIATSLVGALAALAASAVFAAGALGALLIALLALAGPIAAVLIPVFLSLGKVMKVLQQRQQEAAQAEQDKMKLDQEAVQYARAHADAEAALGDALRQQARTAKDNAQSAADAQRAQSIAVANLRDATVKAYQEMADAAEKARDAELSLERARLSKDQAVLGVKQAVAALADFRKESKTASASLDGLFNKFSNVDFKGNAEAIKGALGAAGVKVDNKTELELEQLVLNVRDARLREKEATDGVDDAQKDLNDAQKIHNKFLREGITASDQYKNAVLQVADADRAAARAATQAARARQDAARSVANSKKDISRLEDDRAAQIEQDNLTKSKQMTDQLTGSEQELVGVLSKVWDAMKKAFGPAVAAVIAGIITGIKKITPSIGKMEDALTLVGVAIGQSIGILADLLASPEVTKAFQGFAVAAAAITPIITQVFGSLLTLILQIAQTAMPFLISGVGSLATALTGAASNTDFLTQFSSFIVDLMPHLAAWVGLALSLGQALAYLLITLAPYGLLLVQWITQAATGFAQFANSDNGRQQIAEFLSVAVPLAKAFGTFIWRILGLLIRITEIVGPFITPVLNFLNSSLGLLSALLRPIGLLAIGLGNIAGLLVKMYTVGQDALTKLLNAAETFGINFIQAIIKGITNGIPGLVKVIENLGNKIIDGLAKKLHIGSPSKVMVEMGGNVSEGLMRGIEAGQKRLAQVATNALAVPVLQAAPVLGAAFAATANAQAGTYIAHQDVNLPPGQGGGMGDPRHEAAMFAREMKRRGGGALG